MKLFGILVFEDSKFYVVGLALVPSSVNSVSNHLV